MTTRARKLPAADQDYLALVHEHPLLAIGTDDDHDRSIAMMNRLIDIPQHTPGQAAYMETLGVLIEAHETDLYGEPEVSPARMLASLIESKGVTQAVVARGTGVSDTTISEILAGRREPSRSVMRALGAYFGVNPGIFL
ncbi:helix-turn-helix transcriptional regulator [Isosphaeraceae bacterium EP7]